MKKLSRKEFCKGVAIGAITGGGAFSPLIGDAAPRLFASPVGTVGRRRAKQETAHTNRFDSNGVSLFCGDSLNFYVQWEAPDVIVSDGAYGILGFEGDTIDHTGVPEWYRAHIEAWSAAAKPFRGFSKNTSTTGLPVPRNAASASSSIIRAMNPS